METRKKSELQGKITVKRRTGPAWGVGGQFDEIVYFVCIEPSLNKSIVLKIYMRLCCKI